MDTQDLLRAVQEIVGVDYATAEPLALFAYTRDASSFGGSEAAVVARPASTREVSHIMDCAHGNRVPVVVRGGGASIYGQPKGVPGCNLLLDMTRMNAIVDLNPANMTVTAQAGIIMGTLREACNREDLFVFTPAAPVHTVSLGGWLSGAAGGGGLWWETLSLTVVLPDGTVVTTGGGPGTNVNQSLHYHRCLGGPDMTGLFIGDGGSFGVKTEATIRLVGLPRVTRACIVECAGLDRALALVQAHVSRVTPHPFDPVLVFGSGAMDIFMPGSGDPHVFTAMAMMQGHTGAEMDAKLEAFRALADTVGVRHNAQLDAMAEAMAGGGESDGGVEMFGLGFFNGLGHAGWLPFNIPRARFSDIYPRLIAWRETRLDEAARLGYECTARFEFFTPSDQCSLSGEIDAFFRDSDDPALHAFVRSMIYDFQVYTHELGCIDVYNQGVMSTLNARYWSAGYRSLFRTIKESLDPAGILNPGLWLQE